MKLKLLPADSLALSSGDPGLTETAVWEEWKAKGIGKECSKVELNGEILKKRREGVSLRMK